MKQELEKESWVEFNRKCPIQNLKRWHKAIIENYELKKEIKKLKKRLGKI